MSIYDLRQVFPLSDREFSSPDGVLICRLAEVSDLRPGADRLSWYLVFEPKQAPSKHAMPSLRKLEVVTSADHLIQSGFPPDLETRLENWLLSGEQDGRLEWLDY